MASLFDVLKEVPFGRTSEEASSRENMPGENNFGPCDPAGPELNNFGPCNPAGLEPDNFARNAAYGGFGEPDVPRAAPGTTGSGMGVLQGAALLGAGAVAYQFYKKWNDRKAGEGMPAGGAPGGYPGNPAWQQTGQGYPQAPGWEQFGQGNPQFPGQQQAGRGCPQAPGWQQAGQGYPQAPGWQQGGQGYPQTSGWQQAGQGYPQNSGWQQQPPADPWQQAGYAQEGRRGNGGWQEAPRRSGGFSQEHVFGDAPKAVPLNPTSMLVLRAMVYSARADGVLDGIEMARIHAVLSGIMGNVDIRPALQALQKERIDPAKIAQAVSMPEQAEDVYRLSCMVINLDKVIERQYLDDLAAALGIDERRKMQLEDEANQAKAYLR